MGSLNAELNENDDHSGSATESDEPTNTKTETDEDKEKECPCPPTPASCPYQVNEKVLAFFQSHVYEAKVIQVQYRLKEWTFRVHYLGWNKSWDEWVGVHRLMKDTEANRHRQPVFTKKRDEDKNLKSGHALQMKPRSSNVLQGHCWSYMGRKRKNDSLNKETNGLQMENFVNIQIPPPLKKQLVDDCEFITHLGKLVKLPRTPNVDDILEKYCDYRSKKDGLVADSTGEIVKGLRCYFDKALPIMLLYKSEREQYEDSMAADVSPSSVYGAEHLLRLFVKLPELLVHAKIEEETLTLLQHKLVDLLKFLQKHQSTFFLSRYHSAEDVETSANKQEDD
ncbi:protein MRG2 [Citrus sinensis]|uniref:Protein MRG2 n=1 Tax=Citrus sinensis TaxID=2711 RepID=A0ACB8KUX4_CITSI|nr:protein MRG2 [Citrus sinensis]